MPNLDYKNKNCCFLRALADMFAGWCLDGK